MRDMKELTVWECQHCKQLFKTENRHECKKDPEKKNCFSCKFLEGWTEGQVIDVGFGSGFGQGPTEGPFPVCKNKNTDICESDEDLETIKSINYNMQCEGYCKGEYWKDVYIPEPYPF